jgi:ribose transport system ATP-binding protein
VFNICLASLDRFARRIWVNGRAERKSTIEYISRLHIRHRRPEQLVVELSGGNQQKVLVARWMLRGAKLYIVDEPTAGLDVGARAEVHQILRDLARVQGASVLFISSDFDELPAVADRVVVMRRGSTVAELGQGEVTKAAILRHCFAVAEATT